MRNRKVWPIHQAPVRTQESDPRVTFADWVKKNSKDICAHSGASINIIVWKWSEETFLSKSFPALLENLRPFYFCQAYTDSPLLTEPIYVFSFENVAMYSYNLHRQTPKYCGLVSFLKVLFT